MLLTRRHAIKVLLALGAGSVLFLNGLQPAAAEADAPLKIRWNSDSHEPTPENFTDLCSLITLHDDLDAETMKRIYAAMMDEPWGPSHITRLHVKISKALEGVSDKATRSPMTDGKWGFDDGEKWFARHILTTWYLGIYINAERPTQRLAYETALMYRDLRGKLPVPMVEPMGYGAWEHPPEDKDHEQR